MKYKHTITIADIQMNIITEEDAEVVESMVGVLDRRMREIFLKSQNRCTKIEAALLCALDYCSEKSKLQETVARMEEEMRGVDVGAMFEQIAALKAENEKLTSQLTYSEDQARTMKNGIDIANDQIRILKTQVSEAEEKTALLASELCGAKQSVEALGKLEEKIAELEAALSAKDAQIEEKAAQYDDLNKAYEEAAEKIGKLESEIDELEQNAECAEEAQVEIVEEIEEKVEVVVEMVADEETPDVPQDTACEAVAEVPAEPEKRPVAAIADNIEEAFELDMKPLRRGNVDENQLTIDSALGEDAPEEKAENNTTVEKEKQKAHKRVRSMFDLITFDNV